jgi:hypothetical protein
MNMEELQLALAATDKAATTAAVQAMHQQMQQQQASQQQHHDHKVILPLFWINNPAGWFLHAEAKFLLMRYAEGSYTCDLHAVGAL